jgi:hypothetical protein
MPQSSSLKSHFVQGEETERLDLKTLALSKENLNVKFFVISGNLLKDFKDLKFLFLYIKILAVLFQGP